jgi:hypothetical protein
MTLGAFPVFTSERGIFTTKLRLLGAGAAVMTEVLGANVTMSYIGVGQHRITFNDNPGIWCGPKGAPGFQAATPGDVDAMDAVFGAFTAATATADAYVDLYLYDGGAAHDMSADEWVSFDLDFARRRS